MNVNIVDESFYLFALIKKQTKLYILLCQQSNSFSAVLLTSFGEIY